ncbi:MAG: FtsX-like permease family protein [Pseudomonadota bacterium]
MIAALRARMAAELAEANLHFAWRVAKRELRGGLAGFRIFLACLALGVAGIAAVGSITAAIQAGLAAEGRTILGGDASITLTYRRASAEERDWMAAQGVVSEVADLRSMIGTVVEGGPPDRALAQVKGVDGAYPLYGAAELESGRALQDAIAENAANDGRWGLVAERALVERLGAQVGDPVSLGTGTFTLTGVIAVEPDAAAGGMALGPRAIVASNGLAAAGLLGEGTLYETLYRIRLDPSASLDAIERDYAERFPEAGGRWRDRDNAAPGIARFVQRIGAFLVLVGLAALVIGGVGVGAAVRGYLTRKVPVIASLRTLGAPAGTVFAAYLMQVGVIALFGIVIGLALGGGGIALLGPWIAEQLPVPARFALYPAPLVIAGLYGLLTAALFALWPLSWLREVRPAELFRLSAGGQGGGFRLPRLRMTLFLIGLSVAFGLIVAALSGAAKLALSVMAGIGAALVLLRAVGWLAARGAARLARGPLGRKRPVLRLALGAIGAPGGGAVDITMALGLGLGVLAAIGQVDNTMQRLITNQLPAGAPAFFLVDIQPDQLDPVQARLAEIGGVESIETAPMLRGVITELEGIPAREAEIDPGAAWVLRGDRGVTYSTEPPEGAVLTAGEWWPEDYDGPPLVSFIDEEGRQLGLEPGDAITVSILGRPITATIANLREVEWQGLGINFIMVMSPNALQGAPHTHIATVYADTAAEGPILRALGTEFLNVTAVGIREQIERVSGALGDLGAATRWGALAVLLTGLAVLIGAAGTAAERQVSEAAVLKVLGAERKTILASLALRAALLGAGAGVVALLWGTVAAWGVAEFVLDAEFAPAPGQALAIILGGAVLNLGAGLAFAARPLRLRPAGVLRVQAG